MSAYLMVSLQSEQFNEPKEATLHLAKSAQEEIQKHPWWDERKGWKNLLNNLRLFIQPLCYFDLLKPWLVVVFAPQIIRLFCRLFFQLNQLINSLEDFSTQFLFLFCLESQKSVRYISEELMKSLDLVSVFGE
jgi:hypothetical protein